MPLVSRSTSASEAGIVSSTLPFFRTVILSAFFMTSFILWEITMTAFPLSAILRSVSNMLWASCGVRTADGSSRIKTSAP